MLFQENYPPFKLWAGSVGATYPAFNKCFPPTIILLFHKYLLNTYCVPILHCPIWWPLATSSHWTPAMWPVWTEMCCKCKHTPSFKNTRKIQNILPTLLKRYVEMIIAWDIRVKQDLLKLISPYFLWVYQKIWSYTSGLHSTSTGQHGSIFMFPNFQCASNSPGILIKCSFMIHLVWHED